MKVIMPVVFVALVAIQGFAQSPPPYRPPSWAEEQKAQSWATARLAASPRHQEWLQIPTPIGRQLKAWVEYPAGQHTAPVVIVLHEVFGLTDSTRNTADEIAAMGYIVVVPDMLSELGPGGGGTESFEISRSAAQTLVRLNNDSVDAALDAVADYAAKLPGSTDKLAIVGLSWGGGAAFRYATTHRSDLKAVFVFYDVGPPVSGQGVAEGAKPVIFPATGIRVPVYGFYPERDSRVMASLPATRQAMSQAAKAYEPVIYPGAEHAYMRIGEDPANTNPANAAAAKASLERLHMLLGKVLQ